MKLISSILNNCGIQNTKIILKAARAAESTVKSVSETVGKKLSKSPADPKLFQAVCGMSQKTTQSATEVLATEEYIKNSPLLQIYKEASSPERLKPFLKKIDVLEGATPESLAATEELCERIAKRLKQEGCIRIAPRTLKSLVDLHSLNPKAFEYVMESDTLIEKFFMQNGSSDECLRNLTPASLKEIEEGIRTDLTQLYIDSSDAFRKNSENTNELHKLLAEHKIKSDILVKRAERETGMFSGIRLDDKALCAKIKLANLVSQTKTRKATFSGYTGSYLESARKSDLTIYRYIKDKKDLSLADAMLMMPYLDEKTRQTVLDKITGSVIYDDRFKSTTFSDSFPMKWLSGCSCQNDQAKIISSITVQKGTEGRYINIPLDKEAIMPSSQCELLLNNTRKEIVITGATYDPVENIFYISSNLKNV